MRTLQRNMRPFYYCLYVESEDQYDEYGNLLPEPLKIYGEPVLMYANISAATGQAQAEQFGNLDSYDKVIVTTDMSCPIDEHTVLFIDKVPESISDDEDETDESESEGETEDAESDNTEQANDSEEESEADEPYVPPKYDYIVKRVAKSINGISIAIRKVDVG